MVVGCCTGVFFRLQRCRLKGLYYVYSHFRCFQSRTLTRGGSASRSGSKTNSPTRPSPRHQYANNNSTAAAAQGRSNSFSTATSTSSSRRVFEMLSAGATYITPVFNAPRGIVSHKHHSLSLLNSYDTLCSPSSRTGQVGGKTGLLAAERRVCCLSPLQGLLRCPLPHPPLPGVRSGGV